MVLPKTFRENENHKETVYVPNNYDMILKSQLRELEKAFKNEKD